MRIAKKFSILSATLLALSAVVFFTTPSFALSELTAEQTQLITTNCVSTKATLNRLHSSDALLRVNVGQIYETVGNRLINNFNARVVSNNMNSVNLIASGNDYDVALKAFRADYISYEEQLSQAMKIDCSKEPATFFDATAQAREKRKVVYADVAKLKQQIEHYIVTVDQFQAEYLAAANGVKE